MSQPIPATIRRSHSPVRIGVTMRAPVSRRLPANAATVWVRQLPGHDELSSSMAIAKARRDLEKRPSVPQALAFEPRPDDTTPAHQQIDWRPAARGLAAVAVLVALLHFVTNLV